MGTTFNISPDPVIALDHVHVAWEHDLILHGITASIPQGQCVAVTGPNGAGKSTLMKAILGTAPISSGDITLFGNSTQKRSSIPWQCIGYVPQRASSGGAISSSCIEVVLSGLLGTRKWWHSRGDRAKALEALRAVGLAHRVLARCHVHR